MALSALKIRNGLCECCRGIFLTERLSIRCILPSKQPHHQSILDFSKASSEGCILCDYILGILSSDRALLEDGPKANLTTSSGPGFLKWPNSELDIFSPQILYYLDEDYDSAIYCKFSFTRPYGSKIFRAMTCSIERSWSSPSNLP
ncbi:uncharacterized protein RSE6_03573 [Rhynchosporium secalis]|uniref:Uncharacterized protein n=1 Tax=Rhynchosporium secalis TaxID=38038 RepID=A0A1E1M339_RHYSE|nr:uncharacterized protein RSE6_03573 [Rhynchosporium secalis]